MEEQSKAGTPPPPVIGSPRLNMFVTKAEIERAFTEWDRRFREDPERFISEGECLLKETPETYGAACAPYFLQLVEEVKTGKIV